MQVFHTFTITEPNSPAGKPAGTLKRLACSSIIGDNVIDSAEEALGRSNGENQLG